MAASNSNLEKAEFLILIESEEFQYLKDQISTLLQVYRGGEDSHAYATHYVLDFYSDGSGSISCGDQDYLNGKYIVEYP